MYWLVVKLGDLCSCNPNGYETELYPVNPNDAYLLTFNIIHPSRKDIKENLEEIIGVPYIDECNKFYQVTDSKETIKRIVLIGPKEIHGNLNDQHMKEINFESGLRITAYPPSGDFFLKVDYAKPLDDQINTIKKIDEMIKPFVKN